MKLTPLGKQSKKKRREYYASRRGSWNGLSPVTRVAKSKKVYDRKREKRDLRRREGDAGEL